MATGEKVARGVVEREMLDAEIHDAKLKWDLMEDWKKSVADANKETTAAVSRVAEVNGELGKVAEKRKAFKGKLKKIAAESCLW